MKISLIAAIDENRGLGKGNELLWRIPEDLKNFKKLTRYTHIYIREWSVLNLFPFGGPSSIRFYGSS